MYFSLETITVHTLGQCACTPLPSVRFKAVRAGGGATLSPVQENLAVVTLPLH